MLRFVVDTEFRFRLGSEGCVKERGESWQLCVAQAELGLRMACMLKSLGPAPASALCTAPLHSLMDHLTHIFSHSVSSAHPPSSSVLSFILSPSHLSYIPELSLPVVLSLIHLSMDIYIYMSCAQKPISFPSLKHVIPAPRTTPACAIKAPVL